MQMSQLHLFGKTCLFILQYSDPQSAGRTVSVLNYYFSCFVLLNSILILNLLLNWHLEEFNAF